jgi:hypothetical protein
MTLAIHNGVLLAIALAIVCGAVIALIVIAPWKRVRQEPPIPETIETRLLLGEDPGAIVEEEVKEEEDAREQREGGEVFDLDPQRRPGG